MDIAQFIYDDKALYQYLLSVRQQLHTHPELSGQEYETSAFIKKELLGLGLELLDMDIATGAAARLQGGLPGPAVGIRADMDALPLHEESGACCPSQKPGVMHACGHDVHMTALLGAAKLLSQNRENIHGDIIFLFQPAEETVLGASAVLDSGLFQRFHLEGLICIHVWPKLPLGQVGLGAGAFLSAVDSFKLSFTGRGGHGSMPCEAVNPIIPASQLALAASAIPSCELSPFETAALSICSINAGHSDNVIPDTCQLLGTARTFSSSAHNKVLERLRTLAENFAAAYGCKAELQIDHSLPPVVNDTRLTQIMGDTADRLFGQGAWQELEPVMISEDFACYASQVPICCGLFGVGGNESLHCAAFYPPDEVLLPAARYLSACALGILGGAFSE